MMEAFPVRLIVEIHVEAFPGSACVNLRSLNVIRLDLERDRTFLAHILTVNIHNVIYLVLVLSVNRAAKPSKSLNGVVGK